MPLGRQTWWSKMDPWNSKWKKEPFSKSCQLTCVPWCKPSHTCMTHIIVRENIMWNCTDIFFFSFLFHRVSCIPGQTWTYGITKMTLKGLSFCPRPKCHDFRHTSPRPHCTEDKPREGFVHLDKHSSNWTNQTKCPGTYGFLLFANKHPHSLTGVKGPRTPCIWREQEKR